MWGGIHRSKKDGTKKGKHKSRSKRKRSKEEPESAAAASTSAGEGKSAVDEEKGEHFVRESVVMGEKADENTNVVDDVSASSREGGSQDGGSSNSTALASSGKVCVCGGAFLLGLPATPFDTVCCASCYIRLFRTRRPPTRTSRSAAKSKTANGVSFHVSVCCVCVLFFFCDILFCPTRFLFFASWTS